MERRLGLVIAGADPTGLALAKELLQCEDFSFVAYAGPEKATTLVSDVGIPRFSTRDLESALALPEADVVLVAEDLAHRAATLRRALQAEKHAICLFPPELVPEVCYEVTLAVEDARRMCVCLAPIVLHPGVQTLLRQLRAWPRDSLRHVALAYALNDADPLATSPVEALYQCCSFLLACSGSVAEVHALADYASGTLALPCTVSGRYQRGGLFQLLLTASERPAFSVEVATGAGQVTLQAPSFAAQPASLTTRTRTETFSVQYPATATPQVLAVAIAEQFRALRQVPQESQDDRGASASEKSKTTGRTAPGDIPHQFVGADWEHVIRSVELGEAILRSAQRKKAIALYEEDWDERAAFKSRMTVAGCLTLLACLALLFMGALLPALWYGIPLLLAVYLVLQLLHLVVPERKRARGQQRSATEPQEASRRLREPL